MGPSGGVDAMRKVFWMLGTPLGRLNFLVLQWGFVRLVEVCDDTGTHSHWGWFTGVVPLTGWWSDYRYLWGNGKLKGWKP